MKSLTKNYVPFLFVFFLILSSCDVDTNTNSSSDDTGMVTGENSPELMEAELAAPAYKTCNCPTKPTKNYEISADCANCMRDNFALNNYQLPKGTAGPIKGFKVAYKELQEIVGDGSDIEVFTMMGIRATDNGSGGQDIEADIFHQVQTAGRDGAAATSVYYDFTQPCPNYCPE